MKINKRLIAVSVLIIIVILMVAATVMVVAAGEGDVAGAVEGTWNDAKTQIRKIVDKVVFPILDAVLAIFFFIKLGGAYFDYKKQGQFDWTAPAILFACLVFMLTAPLYIWDILGWQQVQII